MKFGPVCRSLSAGVALGALLAFPARAQDSASGASDYSGDSVIVVTARRVEERLQDVPISITVLNQEQIDNRNISNSVELATYTPSLGVNARFGPEKASFSIRGFSQELSTEPTVGVYFADVVAPRLRSNITSGNGAGVGQLFDLANVQVLKGPQGTLFGRNTTGGAVLLVPKKPSGDLEGYVEATYGNYDQRRIQAVLNVPLSDTFKIRGGVDWNKRDGYLINRSGIGPDRLNDLDYISARLYILGELTPTLENSTIITYTRSDTNNTTGKIAFCNRGEDPNSFGGRAIVRPFICDQVDRDASRNYGFYDVENSAPQAGLKQQNWQVINTTTWEASDTLTIKNIASYGQSTESYSFNITGDNTPFPFVITYPGPNNGEGDQWTFSEELQFQGSALEDRLVWQMGGYLERSGPISQQEQVTSIFSTCTDVYAYKCTPFALALPTGPLTIGSVGVTRNTYSYHNEALYAQATYDLTDRLSLTGGLRYTWDWIKVNSDAVTITPSPTGPVAFRCSRAPTPANPGPELGLGGLCTRSFQTKSGAPTWLIDLDYKPSENLLIYAKWARGYRAGGVNELNQGSEIWNPEKLDTYEIGLKATLTGAVRGYFNVAGFWNDFRNQQTSVLIPACTDKPTCAPVSIGGIQNVGKSRIRGAEIDASLTFFDSLRVDLGYTYLDAKVVATEVPNCSNELFNCSAATFLANSGERLPFAPKHRFTLTGTYTLPLDEQIGEISVAATYVYTGNVLHSHNYDRAFELGQVPFNAGIVPAINLFNLNLNWNDVAQSQFDLALFATNVTNKKYYVAPDTNAGSIGGQFFFLGQPRMYGARLRYNF